MSIELRERLADGWERAFPETLSWSARVAGGFFVAYAVLSAAAAHQLVAATGPRVGMFAIASVDALLGLALLVERPRAHVFAAVRLLLGTLLFFFLARGEAVVLGLQVLVLGGMLLLLLGEPDRRRGVAGALVLALPLAPLLTHVAAPYTQSTPLAELVLELRGGLEPGEVTAARGASTPPYQLTFPGTGWRQARPDVLPRWPSEVDRAWLLPRADATVFVESQYIPAAAAVDLDGLIARLQEGGAKAGGTPVELVDSVALDGPFDAARRLHLREKGRRQRMESLTTLWVRGDHVFQITALAPSHRFPALRAELEGILGSFSFQPPRRTALSEQTLSHVRRGTVMVLTPEGSGTGFIFHSANGRSYILTNDHVVRDHLGHVFSTVDVAVEDAKGRRTRLKAIVDHERTDPRQDLAVLSLPHLDTDKYPVMELRHSESLRERAPVVAVGYPFGEALAAGAALPSATVNGGWLFPQVPELRALGRLPVDVGINPGNSGGPLVDVQGRVVGVVVAHRRQSETSFVISTEAVEKFLKREYAQLSVPFEDPAPDAALASDEPPPEERLSAAMETRARGATVLVRSGAQSTAGVVVGRSKERFLVLASTEVLSGKWKPGRTVPPVTVRAHPAHPDSPTRPAQVLRAGAELLLLSVALETAGVEPLEVGDAGGLRTGDVLSMLGFKMDREGRLPQVNPPARLETGVLAGQQRDQGDALEFLQVDLGINHSQTGGPVFDVRGALVGLAVSRVSGTNISLTLSGEHLREFMRGGIRDAAWKLARDFSGRCAVQARVALADPLGTLESVTLRLGPDEAQWKSRDVRHLPAMGSAVATVPTEGRQTVELLSEVPCSDSPRRLQLEVRDGKGARRTLARLVPVYEGKPQTVFGRTGGTYLSADMEPELLTFAMEPVSPPTAWGEPCPWSDAGRCEQECSEGKGDSCMRLGRMRLSESRGTEAVPALERACRLGNVDGCIELGFLVNAKGTRLKTSLTTLNATLERECKSHYARACHAKESARYEAALAELSNECRKTPSLCGKYGGLLLNGSGEVAFGGQRSMGPYTRACDAGVRAACWEAAVLVAQGWASGSLEAAASSLEEGCLKYDNAVTCLYLAQLHARGQGVPRNLLQAGELAARACKNGDKRGCALFPEFPVE